MQRTALIVAYNGQPYHGWQFQDAAIPTVQRDLTRAVSKVADTTVSLHCAGRTDAGVHATGQVVHFDTEAQRPSKAWMMGVNTHLGDDISVEWAGQVADDFDARRTAIARRYVYLIHNHKARSALMPGYLTHELRPLNAGLMDEAARALLGKQDFSAFRAASCQSVSPVRHVSRIRVHRSGDLVMIDITANAFLHHMVRNIAGALVDVGAGAHSPAWIAELMEAKDRNAAGVTAPPNGLYLVDVRYPDEAGIPPGPRVPHFLQLLESSE